MAATLSVLNLGYGNVQSIRYAFARIHCSTEVIHTPEALMQAERIVIPGVGAARTAIAALHRLHLWEPLIGFQRPTLGICLGMQLMAQHLDEGDRRSLAHNHPKNNSQSQGNNQSPNTDNNPCSNTNKPPAANIGLGWFQGRIQALKPRSGILPHMGWNALMPYSQAGCLQGHRSQDRHSQDRRSQDRHLQHHHSQTTPLALTPLPKSLQRLTERFAQKPHFSYFAHSYGLFDQRHALCLTEYQDQPFVSVAFKEPYMGIQAHPERSGAVGEALLMAFLGV